jgi:hypothetical protein
MKMNGIIAVVVIWLFTFCQGAAQMPIEKEPHHKIVLENQQVRVIDLVVPAGDTTLLHTHNAASVVIFLSNSGLAIQNPRQAPVITQVKLGEVVFRDYDVKPVAHTVWSADGSMFRCLVVEVK